jgi:peptidoglycan-N-acetylglucosamine deacetylase
MTKYIILALTVFLSSTAYARKELAVTIDDLPFHYGRYLPDSVESVKFHDILKTLKRHKVQIIGFVVGSRIKAYNRSYLDDLVADGHIIGNHTYTHPDLNSTTVSWYEDDISKGAKAIESWVNEPRYFRYPYLHQGPTAGKYYDIAKFLAANSFINVPVSIDNDDWWYDKNYCDALKAGKKAEADSIGHIYFLHIQNKTNYFDSLAHSQLHRDIKHILLLHMTELNAVYLDSLLTWYEDQGWQFITPSDALSDSLYRMHDIYIGYNGTSWLLRFGENIK